MPKSLYISVNSDQRIGTYFRVKPNRSNSWNDYYSLTKLISLKNDLKWDEIKDLQNMLRKADIWDDFPAAGFTLVNAEFKPGEETGDENQRIDLLYLRDDGGLLPCELKIGGKSKDSHGQLIRYMADLSFQNLNCAYLKKQAKNFRTKITNKTAQNLHKEKFEGFLKKHGISDKFIRLLPGAGILIDEKFAPQLLKAVRYLNNEHGFSIKMLKLYAFVAKSWNFNSSDYLVRLDFTGIQ